MSMHVYMSLCLLCFALVLSFFHVRYEAFSIRSDSANRCGLDQYGVDLPPCQFGESCLNGWCVSSTPPSLPESTGLPVYP